MVNKLKHQNGTRLLCLFINSEEPRGQTWTLETQDSLLHYIFFLICLDSITAIEMKAKLKANQL